MRERSWDRLSGRTKVVRVGVLLTVTTALVGGYVLQRAAVAVPSGTTIRGAVGADFDSQLPPGSVNGADFGVDVSLPRRAGNLLHDADVFINVTHWVNGGGQTQPTTSDTAPNRCSGTVRQPTAAPGVVCIYVAGGDNAANVSGYSVIPGTGGSRYGFKLKWDASNNGDTFIDAVWAYTFP